jgi:hypothetical protein
VTERTYELLRDRYELHPRGTVEIKGKGPMTTYLLVDRLEPRADAHAGSPGVSEPTART